MVGDVRLLGHVWDDVSEESSFDQNEGIDWFTRLRDWWQELQSKKEGKVAEKVIDVIREERARIDREFLKVGTAAKGTVVVWGETGETSPREGR